MRDIAHELLHPMWRLGVRDLNNPIHQLVVYTSRQGFHIPKIETFEDFEVPPHIIHNPQTNFK